MSSAFAEIGNQLSEAIQKANEATHKDEEIQSFMNSQAITQSITFGVQAAGSDSAVLIDCSPGRISMRSGDVNEATFVLSALPEQWQEFFKQTPTVPYQSYWGVRAASI